MKGGAKESVVRSAILGDAENVSLSYLSPDDSLAVFTDYSSHWSFVDPEPDVARIRERFPNASLPVPRPAVNVTLPPAETVRGYGTFTFPYGPVNAGVPEAGRFDVRTYGERVLELTPVVGFKGRGVRETVVGLSPADALLRIERLAGHLSASHASAFLAAVESAEGRSVPTRELWTRALAQEMQRIYNHMHVAAREAEAASQAVAGAQMHAVAEDMLRLQGHVFGHRWLFGALSPGAAPRRLDAADWRGLGPQVWAIAKESARIWELLSETRIFVDRLQGTCVVPRDVAIPWGAVGPVLRASGVGWDDRVHSPVPPYADLFVSVPPHDDGDALARVLVRMDEIEASAVLIEQILDQWPAEASLSEPLPSVGRGRGVARVEGPSGDLIYDVRVRDDLVRSAGIRTSSQANWPAFAIGMQGAVFTDFHFAFESFGLSFADTDG